MFGYLAQLNTHIKRKHEKTAETYMCDKCERSFFEVSKLKKHIEAVHEGIRHHQCNQCHKFYSEKSELRIHISCVHEKLKPFKCELCGKSFGRKTDVNNHPCKNNPKTYEKSPCLICQKIYKNTLTLDSHMKQKHKIPLKQYLENKAKSAE